MFILFCDLDILSKLIFNPALLADKRILKTFFYHFQVN